MKSAAEVHEEIMVAAKELGTCTIVLDGEEAMVLVMMILRARITDANIDPVLKQIAHMVRNEKETCAEAVDFVIKCLNSAGVELPRYLAPLMTHAASKVMEVQDRNS